MKRIVGGLVLGVVVASSAGAQGYDAARPQDVLEATLYANTVQNLPVGGVRATEMYSTIVTQGGPTGPNPGGPTAPGNPDNARFRSNYGQGHDGVVSLLIRTPQGNFGCSGALINSRQVLTAAHCITNGSNVITATSVDTRFISPTNTFGGTITTQAAGLAVNPAYTGLVIADADVAIITLPTEAPAYATPMMLYNGPTAAVLGQQVTFVGFGSVGTGATGDAQPGYAPNTRRFGYNRFDATCNATGNSPQTNSCSLVNNADRAIWNADFDNGGNVGAPVNNYNGNALCQIFGNPVGGVGNDPLLCNRGVTNDLLDEVGIGRGDSGGPALFNGMIVGVASWGARIDNTYAFGGWGTLSGHTNTVAAQNAAWIRSQLIPTQVVPEPSTWALLGVGLVGVGAQALRRRRVA